MAVLLEWMRKLGRKVKPHAVLEPSSEGQLPCMVVVAGFSRYAVTEDGQIINRKTRRVLRQSVDKSGYRRVGIIDDIGKQRGQYVHRIVLAAFTPNPEGYSDSHHIDSDKSNNHLLNLQWVTRKQNQLHMRDFISSRPDSHFRLTMADATIIRERYAEGGTQAELAAQHGVSHVTVSLVVRNKIWHDPNYSPRPSYRLTMADATVIRERYAEGGTQAELAAQHGVHQVTVSKIVRNKIWHDPNYSPPIANGRGRRRQDNQNTQPATAETTEGDDDGSTSDL